MYLNWLVIARIKIFLHEISSNNFSLVIGYDGAHVSVMYSRQLMDHFWRIMIFHKTEVVHSEPEAKLQIFSQIVRNQ